MKSATVVRTPEAEALALRLRKHFAHKVEVEIDGAVSRVRIPAGTFELEPNGGRLAVRALGWIGSHRNARHLDRTRDWVRELRPGAGEALVLAALLHDVERGVPGGISLDEQIAAFDHEEAVRAHSERSARIAAEYLRAQGASAALVQEVEELVRLHERGGSEDADVLQAADSLSFLETNPAAAWVREGRATPEHATRKLGYMLQRIRLDDARRAAQALYEAAVEEMDRAAGALSREAK